MACSIRAFRQGCRVLMAAANSSATAATTAIASKHGRPARILQVVPVSQPLGEFLGVSEVSRTDDVKKVWGYIKSNILQFAQLEGFAEFCCRIIVQNPSNKKEILCDAKLKTIFNGKDQVGFLAIAKLLSQHFVKSS